MKRLKILSAAVSISCGIGVLMAIIVTSNKNTLPRTAVIVPTQSPIGQRANLRAISASRLTIEQIADSAPENIDRTITSAISRKSPRPASRDIADLIAKNVDVENPYPEANGTVTVKSGDTLFAISRRTGINIYRLAEINSLEEPYVIRPGQILNLNGAQ
jgi:LysM repeat protein